MITKVQSSINNFHTTNSVNSQSSNNNSKDITNNTDIAKEVSMLTISSHGKSLSTVDALSKQKSEIAKSKSQLIANTLANGGKLTDIQSELALYKEQLHNLDDKIADEKIKQMYETKNELPKTKRPYSKSTVSKNLEYVSE
ncbi:MAG: hypothetical protein ATN31_03430 [Candidatus Epulonipiscioides saccharophilum]|nr:MAG: hypothetical protein ATN31_03430 [Epulopiscium sp. AS2M-Bin001]